MYVRIVDTAEGSLEATEKPFNLVALPVHYLVEFLRDFAVGLGRERQSRPVPKFADPIDVVCNPLAWLQPS